MGLWYDCGRGLVKAVGFARSDMGADLYLCCPGPSLAGVDPAALRIPGAFLLAVNTAYPRIRPDLWIGMDTPACYDPRLWWEPFPKVCRGSYVNETCGGVPVRRLPNVYFADVERAYVTDIFRRRQHDAKFVWNGNTFIVAVHLAVWLGARRIHLVGCDFGGKQDYHDARHLTNQQRHGNRLLYSRLLSLLPRLRDTAKVNGVELVSCTADSGANAHLEYRPLAEALAQTAARVPAWLGRDVLHSEHARLCRWQRDMTPVGDGVITGADRHQEWMLPWWFEQVQRWTRLPVAFADFGMTPAMRAWCSERGLVLKVPAAGEKSWHRKPFALLASPFRRTLWLDADCQVCADLAPVFPYADRGLGVTSDPYTGFCPQPGAVATGVVVCSYGEPAVEEWAKEILLRKHRGDQEALNAIRGRLTGRIVIMPPEFQRLRLDPPERQADAVILHWTGPAGKQHIAGELARQTAVPAAG